MYFCPFPPPHYLPFPSCLYQTPAPNINLFPFYLLVLVLCGALWCLIGAVCATLGLELMF